MITCRCIKSSIGETFLVQRKHNDIQFMASAMASQETTPKLFIPPCAQSHTLCLAIVPSGMYFLLKDKMDKIIIVFACISALSTFSTDILIQRLQSSSTMLWWVWIQCFVLLSQGMFSSHCSLYWKGLHLTLIEHSIKFGFMQWSLWKISVQQTNLKNLQHNRKFVIPTHTGNIVNIWNRNSAPSSIVQNSF